MYVGMSCNRMYGKTAGKFSQSMLSAFLLCDTRSLILAIFWFKAKNISSSWVWNMTKAHTVALYKSSPFAKVRHGACIHFQTSPRHPVQRNQGCLTDRALLEAKILREHNVSWKCIETLMHNHSRLIPDGTYCKWSAMMACWISMNSYDQQPGISSKEEWQALFG